MRIGLLPMGPVPPELLDGLSRMLRAYGLEPETLPRAPVPEEALDRRRRQYRADAFLRRREGNPGETVLAVTGVDLFSEGLNFVFGLADLGGDRAVVSIRRLAATDGDLFSTRVLKECIHELGHTWGLGHCDDAACVMHFSNSLAETDAKGARFCEACERSLPEGLASPPPR